MSFIQSSKRYFIKFCVLIASVLLIATPFAWLQLHHPQTMHSLSAFFAQYVVFFIAFRWLFIILFVSYWSVFVRYYAKKQQWSQEKTEFWLAQRFRIAGWMIIFELLVCENLLMTLWKAL